MDPERITDVASSCTIDQELEVLKNSITNNIDQLEESTLLDYHSVVSSLTQDATSKSVHENIVGTDLVIERQLKTADDVTDMIETSTLMQSISILNSIVDSSKGVQEECNLTDLVQK